jgi:hypothetical protein
VSRNIRNERENCCDDLAVKICGDTVAYVCALTELEQMRKCCPPRGQLGRALAPGFLSITRSASGSGAARRT